MECIIECYDRRTDRDRENLLPTENAFISAAGDLLRNDERSLCPQPFQMGQSSKANWRCEL